MKTSELIGKSITDVKDKIETYDSNDELLVSNGVIKLQSGERFNVPNRDSETLTLIENIALGYASIFNNDGFFKKIFSKEKYDRKIANRNKEAIKGKVIVGIYQYDEQDNDEEWIELENMIIEVESGFMISEISMAPYGNCAAGIMIFISKNELINRYGNKLKKVY